MNIDHLKTGPICRRVCVFTRDGNGTNISWQMDTGYNLKLVRITDIDDLD
jgi:hypothetical protein